MNIGCLIDENKGILNIQMNKKKNHRLGFLKKENIWIIGCKERKLKITYK